MIFENAGARCRALVNVRQVIFRDLAIEKARGFRRIYDRIARGGESRAIFREVGPGAAPRCFFVKRPEKTAMTPARGAFCILFCNGKCKANVLFLNVIENARGFRDIYDKIVRGAWARARFREVGLILRDGLFW